MTAGTGAPGGCPFPQMNGEYSIHSPEASLTFNAAFSASRSAWGGLDLRPPNATFMGAIWHEITGMG